MIASEKMPGEAPVAAVIAAAGSSSRMGGLKKEYLPLGGAARDGAGKPLSVLGAALLAFVAVRRIGMVVISYPGEVPGGEAALRASLPGGIPEKTAPEIRFVPGGPSRRASVHRALAFLEPYCPEYVLIHDGARPWIEPDLIRGIIAAAEAHGAAIPLMPLTETPKETDGRGFILRHLKRALTGTAQTPQGFAFPAILRAHEQAARREEAEGPVYTDDAEIWGEFCGPVAAIPGSPRNRKITFPEDLEIPVR
ncbi:MAG: 2-C-methyl-D-erythritol 4-phosphate cytidylyltransferase [Treponema sp.]|jgi:2-C-methyl-D-erythritol 4-phosphate cytidylyltransferase/2-C-methyl-D-erythritol 4-phosphate cytidylyltransferase/2-C-methyl-D-erythritol 2,4-cyclodiphosphate synthase|nr:2-C-methyl-D-erythritol 4-phosphate cytidylyltransferase [Treponema sp.]